MMARSETKTESTSDAPSRCTARLLDAAGEVFAEVGYRDATIREICGRAGANVASVNYHFGDKAQLYSQTLRHLANETMHRFPIAPELPKGASAEQRLRAFVESFLLRLFSDERAALYGRIMAREFVEPTHALRERIDESVRPMINQVASIAREVLGKRATDDQVRRTGFSIVGQILFYKHTQPVTAHLFPEEKFDRESITQLTDHITSFSMAGLNALAARIVAGKV